LPEAGQAFEDRVSALLARAQFTAAHDLDMPGLALMLRCGEWCGGQSLCCPIFSPCDPYATDPHVSRASAPSCAVSCRPQHWPRSKFVIIVIVGRELLA